MNPMALSCISRNILSPQMNETQEGIRCISPDLGTCEAKVNGVPCQRPASVTITVNAGCWRGLPAEERRICLYHNAMLCRGQPQEKEGAA